VSYAIGVMTFVVALLLSVMLHEAGHFATAKAFGMKASRFFVGFGPTLWSVRRGETEYGVKAIPAGGFVKIEGMTALEELEPGDEDRAFYKQPALQRTIVLAAGSVVHFVLAIGILFAVIAGTGFDPVHVRPSTQIQVVEKCVPRNPDATACTSTDPAAPAFGVIKAGDRVVAVNGDAVSTYNQMAAKLRARPGTVVRVTVLRHGQRRTFGLKTVPVEQNGHLVGKIGISPRIENIPVSVAGAVPKTFTTLGFFTKSTVSALGSLPSEISGIVQGKPRNPEGAASVVDVARVSGQIAEAHATVGNRIAQLMLLVAELNFFVGIFNLLPLLPLDGGHIGILGFEKARAALYRLIGRRDPGRVDIMKVLPLTYAVVAVFVGLSVILLYAGIFNPIKLQ
jgi:membrane-associated protease RseP (regulator of RpoE activity)